jgi:hypothetical protein
MEVMDQQADQNTGRGRRKALLGAAAPAARSAVP